LIRIYDVSVEFPGGGGGPFIRGANLTIRDGEWVAIAGGNGSGKTTLCRLIAGIESPSSGAVEVDGADPFQGSSAPGEAPSVGIAFQNPDSQFVTSSVSREIAFGMENLSMESAAMQSRLARAARSFDLEAALTRNPHTLSGGEKQRLLLASLWAMVPRHLILDEPFSFLDAAGRTSFLETLRSGFRGEGKTILWSTVDAAELDLADRVIYLERGEILFDGPPRDLERSIPRETLESALVHLSDSAGAAVGPRSRSRASGSAPGPGDPLIEFRGAALSPGGGFVLNVPSLSIGAGERVGISGPSGSGKTTLLLACAGLLFPREGTATLFGRNISSSRDFPAGRVAFLFQNPEEGFFAATIREEIALAHRSFRGFAGEGSAVTSALETVGLDPADFLERNPYHCSQGEKRLVALASLLTLGAKAFILDEPTIFLDGGARRRFASALARIESGGASIIIASHDARFLRQWADRCISLDAGAIIERRKQSL